jgi:uncharacterized protein (TIGR03437 family)
VNQVIRIAGFFSVVAVTTLAAIPASPAATDPEREGATRSAAPSETPKLSAGSARLKMAQVPLSFEANQGQTDSVVKFFSRGDGYALFLTPTEAVFKLHQAASAAKQPSVVRMKLVGADGTARIWGADQHSGTANYFVGNDPHQWRTGVATYGRVHYQGLYPGVDAVFYGNQRELEYDLTVAPGVDPRLIALEFSGARPKINRDGDLVLKLNGDRILLHKPVVYQGTGAGKRPVDGSYTLAGNRVTFQIGRYDRSQPLVIDPVLSYLTYLGGTNADNIGYTTGYYPSGETNPTQGLAVDSLGNAYVTGYTYSLNFPLQNAYQATPKQLAHYQTVFVTKLNASGTGLVYSTYLGGSVFEGGEAIAVDSSGSAYIAGFTNSPDFPVTKGAFMTVCDGSTCGYYGPSNGFLTKLSSDGKSLVYSTFLGGQSGDATGITAVAVDSKGQAYVAGETNSACWSVPPSVYYTTTHCFPTTKGAVIPGAIYDISSYPDSLEHAVNNQGSAFVTVFDAAGANLLYSTLFCDADPTAHFPLSAEFETNATGVAVDALGNFYLVGTTKDAYLPTTSGAFQPSFPTASGATALGYVAKFSPVNSPGGSSLVYASYLGGTDKTAYAQTAGVAADASGNAYVTGITASPAFPVTPGAYQITCGVGCGLTGFVTKIKPDGSALVWSTMLGNLTNAASGGYYGPVDAIGPIQVDANGNVYVAGESAIGFPEVNPIQTTTGGGAQAFVAKLNPTGSALLFSSLVGGGGNLGSQGAAGLAVDGQGNIYLAGNTNAGSMAVTPGAFQQAFGKGQGVGAGFIAKISPPSSTPAIAPSVGVVSGASFQAGIVPNSWITIYGTNLSPKTDTWDNSVVNGTLPTSLDGVGVSVGGLPAYISYISPGQINALAPNVGPGNLSVTVTNASGTSAPVTAVAQMFQPAFFHWGNYAVATRTDYTLAVKNGTFPGSPTVAAKPGDVIVLWGTGFGPTSPAAPTGIVVPSGTTYNTAKAVTVTVGPAAAVVYGAAQTSGEAGLYQVAIQIPTTLADGDYPIVATVSGAQSPASTLITVQK